MTFFVRMTAFDACEISFYWQPEGFEMVFAWFNAKEAKAFGTDLADFYLARVQTQQATKSTKFVENKQRVLLEKLDQKIAVFRCSHKLNIYKKAQLGNAFKWRLLQAGFDTAYVDELTSWIVHKL